MASDESRLAEIEAFRKSYGEASQYPGSQIAKWIEATDWLLSLVRDLEAKLETEREAFESVDRSLDGAARAADVAVRERDALAEMTARDQDELGRIAREVELAERERDAARAALRFWVERADRFEAQLPDNRTYMAARGATSDEYALGRALSVPTVPPQQAFAVQPSFNAVCGGHVQNDLGGEQSSPCVETKEA